MPDKNINLIITGVGGQGNVLSSQLIGKRLVEDGYFVTIGETYGSSQRGGSVMSHIKISAKRQLGALIPKGMADIVVALEPVEAIRILVNYGNENVVTLVNTRPIYPVEVSAGLEKYPDWEEIHETFEKLAHKLYCLPATETAMNYGPPVLGNMIMMGALVSLGKLPITPEKFCDTIRENIPPKNLEINLRAFEEGLNFFDNN